MAKRTPIYIEVEPELRDRCKAAAALSGTTLKQWAMDALTEKLEREGSSEFPPGFIVLNAPEGSLEDTLKLVKKNAEIIKAGSKGPMDAAEDINAMRSERLDSILG
ncbi:MAG: hypothetical protein IIB17_03815 [Chloroflexi bacterium]|nr:hypothetical protein [Chloroflexota bacterium]